MLEAIVLKLLTTLTGYLFQGYLDTLQNINIEGAPSWYGKNQSSENIYAYGYAKGGIESIETARGICRVDMVNKLNSVIELTVYDNFKNVDDPKEKALLAEFKKDPEIDMFVLKNMKYEKIEHFDEQKDSLLKNARPAQTFAGGMIPKKVIIAYQKERLEKIKFSLTHFRANSADDELDRAFGK